MRHKPFFYACSVLLLIGLSYDVFLSVYTLIGYVNIYFILLASLTSASFSVTVAVISFVMKKLTSKPCNQKTWMQTLLLGNLLLLTAFAIWYVNLPNIRGNMDYMLSHHYTQLNKWETPKLNQATRNIRVVVSLSTIPNRVFRLNATLESIINQTVQADAIYLNLPKYSNRLHMAYPEYTCPYPQVTVLDTEDFGPLTKLLPAIYTEHDPDTIIITVDDDRIYRPTLIEDLVFHSLQNPSAAIGIGWSIMRPVYPSGMAGIYPTRAMLKDHKEGVLVDILQGYAGVAYRRKFFDPELLKKKPEACFTLDDVFISGYLSTVTQAKKVSIGSPSVKKVYSKEEADKDETRLGYVNHHGDNRRFIKCVEALEDEFGKWNTINF